MKKVLITLLLSLFIITGFSQNARFQYTGRYTPAINQAKLNEAEFIYDIMPEFNRYFVLPFNEQYKFNRQTVTLYPNSTIYPAENYSYLFNYISVEISAICDDKIMTAQSTGDVLTPEQKNIINLAELGTDINVKIRFNYKNDANTGPGSDCKSIEGVYAVTIVPETEAVYPGGFAQFAAYVTENVFNKIQERKATEKIQQAVLKFTIDEQGQVVDARIASTSTDPQIDELLLDAAIKMPKWTPAQNSMGIKVKQEFSIPLGGGGC